VPRCLASRLRTACGSHSARPQSVEIHRLALAPAALHEKDELTYVLQGTGNIMAGGKLVKREHVNASILTVMHQRQLLPGDLTEMR
jgi:hypothetical protein